MNRPSYATLPFDWGMHEPQKGNSSANDQTYLGLADWLRTNHIEAKGHPLVGHDLYPAWVPSEPDATAEVVQQPIATIIAQFKGDQ